MKMEQSCRILFSLATPVDAPDEEFVDDAIVGPVCVGGGGGRVARQKSVVSPRKKSLERGAIALHEELPITPTWRANYQMVRSGQPTGVFIPVV
jgi:hypothetical protein